MVVTFAYLFLSSALKVVTLIYIFVSGHVVIVTLTNMFVCDLDLYLCFQPCSGCLNGVTMALMVCSTYGLSDLHTEVLQWNTKYYSRLWPTRPFAQLPQEVLAQCEEALIQDIVSVNRP